MSENDDGFDDIVNNQPEGEDSEPENILDALETAWPKFYPGIMLKGVVIAEYLDPDGDRVMRFVSSPDMSPWELLGMLESARLDAREISQRCTVNEHDGHEEDDDDD